jgi:hypothetical protein
LQWRRQARPDYHRIFVTSGIRRLHDLWQQSIALEAAPALLGGLRELEDHGERGFVGQATFRSRMALAGLVQIGRVI